MDLIILVPLNVKFCPRDGARKIIRNFREEAEMRSSRLHNEVSPALWCPGGHCAQPLFLLLAEREARK